MPNDSVMTGALKTPVTSGSSGRIRSTMNHDHKFVLYASNKGQGCSIYHNLRRIYHNSLHSDRFFCSSFGKSNKI